MMMKRQLDAVRSFVLLSCAVTAFCAARAEADKVPETAVRRPSTLPSFNAADLMSTKASARVDAIIALRRNDPLLRKYDPVALSKISSDSDGRVRGAALITLSFLYGRQDSIVTGATLTADQVLNAVMKSLDDTDIRVKAAASKAVETFGPRAIAAAEKLQAILGDPKQDSVSVPAARALRAIDPSEKLVVSLLTPTARPATKSALIDALSDDRDHSKVPFISSFLNDGDATVRIAVIRALTRLRIRDAKIVEGICALSGDHDKRVVASVIRSIAVIGTKAQLQTIIDKNKNDTAPIIKNAIKFAEDRGSSQKSTTTNPPADTTSATSK